jgi:hypothetical protein
MIMKTVLTKEMLPILEVLKSNTKLYYYFYKIDSWKTITGRAANFTRSMCIRECRIKKKINDCGCLLTELIPYEYASLQYDNKVPCDKTNKAIAVCVEQV